MKRTPIMTESKVLALIVTGQQYAAIASSTGVPISTIKKIRKRNLVKIRSCEAAIENEQLTIAGDNLKQTYVLLNRILDRVNRDEVHISIRDLLTISSTMRRQTDINATPKAPPQRLKNLVQKYQ